MIIVMNKNINHIGQITLIIFQIKKILVKHKKQGIIKLF